MTDEEIIRACAGRVMGWTYIQPDDDVPWDFQSQDGSYIHTWNPLNSDADCFMLVDKLAVENREFTLERGSMVEFGGYAWYANFDDAGVARDPDRRRCIVLAALKAVGAEQEGK